MNKLKDSLEFLKTLSDEEIKRQFEESFNKFKDVEYKEIFEMNEIKIFENANFGKIRISQKEDESIWFCLSDICKSLEIGNPSDVKNRLVNNGVDSIEVVVNSGLGEQKVLMNFINEPNLYKCIFQSRKPEAEKFQNWIFEEVLPSIRKHGIYATENTIDRIINDPDFGIKLLTELKKEKEEKKKLEEKIQEYTPKVEFHDTVMKSDDWLDMSEVCKTLKTPFGRNRLFEFLRKQGILDDENRPYQSYVDRSYFKLVETSFTTNGKIKINLKTVVSQKGLNWLLKILKKKGVI